MQAIVFCLNCALLTAQGVSDAQSVREPIRLLETLLSEYVLITIIIIINFFFFFFLLKETG